MSADEQMACLLEENERLRRRLSCAGADELPCGDCATCWEAAAREAWENRDAARALADRLTCENDTLTREIQEVRGHLSVLSQTLEAMQHLPQGSGG